MGEETPTATVNGRTVPDVPDLARMRAERFAKLQDELARQGVDGLVLLTTSAASYAAGVSAPGDDAGRAALFRNVVVVVSGEPAPHVYAAFPEVVPGELPADHLHGPLFPDLDESGEELRRALSSHFPDGALLGADDLTHPMARHLAAYRWCDGRAVLAPAKLRKTPDELACIRTAQRLSELAMADARLALRPGVRQSDLSAVFLRRVFELGASSGAIDPIWQVMAPWRADGPWTSHGDLAYPTPTTDRILRHGDVIWVDAGVLWHGYASDYGSTWITGAPPTARQREQFGRWRRVVDAVLGALGPGVTAAQLGRVAVEANGGVRPWIEHFYLAHGVGTDSAELPLVGTDLGSAFDETQVMEPGTVLVLEPVIWEDGAAGYRAEDIVAVTDTGWAPLSGSEYAPFEVAT